MKVLVTGGGGFVGLSLVRRLVENAYEVSTFSRNEYPEHQKLGVKIFRGDLCNSGDIENACKGIEAVFHTAAKVGIWGRYSDFYRTNVTGTENVINACMKQGVKYLIYTSSASVVFNGSDLEGVEESREYPEKHSLNNYTSTKAEAERQVLRANSEKLKTIALRPHLIWGPGDTQLIPKIIHRAKIGKMKKPGRKDFLVDTTFIENYTDAEILSLEKMEKLPEVCGKAYFITNGEPVKAWDFLNSIIRSAGYKPVEETVPKMIALAFAWVLEQIHMIFHLEKEPFITRFLIKELTAHHWFDISAARNLLDYSPRISMKQGMDIFKKSLLQG
ncbi:MAG TPA: NAD-dependent epimerase/dehydratase family protein [Bacteroidales bacterium]|nr:NAD-dependent epimerase/dehydratase family protein [Bacteroidales bacterium]HPR74098.1 NAD-dependent epimerase/dehydratase family protein [Bacteroidales bacterium]HRW86707.1 NAD-dependent epimerase/dehydratase family protein [Bacteroidales bacterium]